MSEDPLRALLVDDDEDEYVLLRDLFAQLGERYTLDWASRYDEGLADVQRGGHDVYLVDYQLGARSGIELITEATSGGARQPLILLTGHRRSDIDVAALRAGAADYLDKGSLTPELLDRSLRYAIERARAVETRMQLEAAHKTADFQRRIVAIVGHDLRNPLTAVLTAISLVERNPHLPPDKLRARMERARAACYRMEAIIRDLTDYTKLQIGDRLPVVIASTNFNSVCEQVLDELQAMFPGRRVEYDPEGDPTGHWDAARLAQVLGNLLTNALKYSPPDTVVHLAWHREGDEHLGEDIVIEVHNEGTPIAEEQLAYIFDPYRRASHKGARDSLGLGLYIVKQIVEAHCGSIDVRSTAGDGTTFTVRLPRNPRVQRCAAFLGAERAAPEQPH